MFARFDSWALFWCLLLLKSQWAIGSTISERFYKICKAREEGPIKTLKVLMVCDIHIGTTFFSPCSPLLATLHRKRIEYVYITLCPVKLWFTSVSRPILSPWELHWPCCLHYFCRMLSRLSTLNTRHSISFLLDENQRARSLSNKVANCQYVTFKATYTFPWTTRSFQSFKIQFKKMFRSLIRLSIS